MTDARVSGSGPEVPAAGAPSATEVLAAFVLLSALAAVVFVPYVVGGGFFSDDWSNAALFGRLSYADGVAETAGLLGARPLLAVFLPIPHELFPSDPEAHLALGVALGVLTCLAFFAVLRALSVPRWHAAAMACLALVFPWSDSIRLWATASVNTISVLFALVGIFLALRSLGAPGRSAWALHTLAIAFFLLSLLTYEAAAGVMLLVGALYFGRTSRARAIRFWVADAAAIGAGLAYTAASIERNVGGVVDRVEDVPRYAEQAIAILSLSFVPPGTTDRAVRFTAIVTVAIVVTLAVRRYRRTGDDELGYWLRVGAAAVVAIAASYAILLGTYLEPIHPGEGNRANLVAEYGYAVLVVALVMVAVRALGLRGRAATVAAAAGIALLGAVYIGGIRVDERLWDRGAALQRPVLEAVDRAALPPGATVLTFGHPAVAAPGVPIFYVTWDLDGAVKLLEADRRLGGLPIHESVVLHCRLHGIRASYPDTGHAVDVPYGSAYFLDVATVRMKRIDTREDCLAARRTFAPGDYVA